MSRGIACVVIAFLLAGCGKTVDTGGGEPWMEPSNYSYQLSSNCGERILIGTFWVTVVDHVVIGVDARDPAAAAVLEQGYSDAVPSLSELIAEYTEAIDGAADVVEIEQGGDGHPESITVDWSSHAMDDEACYKIADYVVYPDALSTVDQANLACVDYYRHWQNSYAEESYYYAAFAERLDGLGFTEAAADYQVLAGVAAGEPFEGAEPELAAIMADAGAWLGDAGATRCVDLAEIWGILGYDGRTEAVDLFERQRSIWDGLGVSDYRLRITIGRGNTERQCHVDVVDGEVTAIADALTGAEVAEPPLGLPFTVDGIYATISADDVFSYDFVWSIPGRFFVGDYSVGLTLDPAEFPPPVGTFGETSVVGCGS
jgi:hypothetical protein